MESSCQGAYRRPRHVFNLCITRRGELSDRRRESVMGPRRGWECRRLDDDGGTVLCRYGRGDLGSLHGNAQEQDPETSDDVLDETHDGAG
jgi:hypothetical protein